MSKMLIVFYKAICIIWNTLVCIIQNHYIRWYVTIYEMYMKSVPTSALGFYKNDHVLLYILLCTYSDTDYWIIISNNWLMNTCYYICILISPVIKCFLWHLVTQINIYLVYEPLECCCYIWLYNTINFVPHTSIRFPFCKYVCVLWDILWLLPCILLPYVYMASYV